MERRRGWSGGGGGGGGGGEEEWVSEVYENPFYHKVCTE